MTFHDLHHGELPLLLPNAWDVPSALAFAEAGFAAVGTTSFGVASAAGLPDGGRATRDANLTLARDLAGLPVHLSVDIEDGYADDPGQVADYAAALSVAGVNLEDSTGGRLVPPGAHAAKITAVKRRCPGLFVNARVDNFWVGQETTTEAVLQRAAEYVAAGADGVFVPGTASPEVISELAREIPVPLNVLVIPGLPLGDLAGLGVRRVSTGSLPYRAALLAATQVATAVRDGAAVPAAEPYPEAQDRLVRFQRLMQTIR